MIADMLSTKKLNPIVTKLFIRGRKLKISLVFITRCFFFEHKVGYIKLKYIHLN